MLDIIQISLKVLNQKVRISMQSLPMNANTYKGIKILIFLEKKLGIMLYLSNAPLRK